MRHSWPALALAVMLAGLPLSAMQISALNSPASIIPFWLSSVNMIPSRHRE